MYVGCKMKDFWQNQTVQMKTEWDLSPFLQHQYSK